MSALPNFIKLREGLQKIVKENNGGFGFNMWATLVDRDGVVKKVVFSGKERGDQWPGSRIIAAQKANTANAFSLPNFALSTANLYSAVQPGGSLYGLQHSNPVYNKAAYKGDVEKVGTERDPMIGYKIGGVNVFGGGLPLYNTKGKIIGGLGLSGDSSVADHIICWKLRHYLELDYVPGGVTSSKDDNIIFDIVDGKSSSGWGHPETTKEALELGQKLSKDYAVRKVVAEPSLN